MPSIFFAILYNSILSKNISEKVNVRDFEKNAIDIVGLVDLTFEGIVYLEREKIWGSSPLVNLQMRYLLDINKYKSLVVFE